MSRSPKRSAPDAPVPDATPDATPQGPREVVTAPAATTLATLADLPVAGLTRRRIALLIAALVAAWVIVLFARQVGEASEASTRADAMRAQNEVLAANVAALEQELALIQRQAYIEQQAREYRLGAPREQPFILADDAPPLASDAPGTAATRLGAEASAATPLESWLDLLFGTSADPAARMNRPVPSEPPTPEPTF
ncbi:MAG TPA: septum formation initiator family protein [Candidatus Limnocylindrales bacterium]|nr:septum formation initiator family protein [Candidatus Limnocylindrales bacterium]